MLYKEYPNKAIPKEMWKPIVQKASMAKRPSKTTATMVSKIAGRKMLGWLAPIKRESTKPVAKPSTLLAIAFGSRPVNFWSKWIAASRFQADRKTKNSRLKRI